LDCCLAAGDAACWLLLLLRTLWLLIACWVAACCLLLLPLLQLLQEALHNTNLQGKAAEVRRPNHMKRTLLLLAGIETSCTW
jgi:hypothetical protein